VRTPHRFDKSDALRHIRQRIQNNSAGQDAPVNRVEKKRNENW